MTNEAAKRLRDYLEGVKAVDSSFNGPALLDEALAYERQAMRDWRKGFDEGIDEALAAERRAVDAYWQGILAAERKAGYDTGYDEGQDSAINDAEDARDLIEAAERRATVERIRAELLTRSRRFGGFLSDDDVRAILDAAATHAEANLNDALAAERRATVEDMENEGIVRWGDSGHRKRFLDAINALDVEAKR